MNMKKKWAKAQTLEPLHWLDNKEKIASEAYQQEIKQRAIHIFTNIEKKLSVSLSNKKSRNWRRSYTTCNILREKFDFSC